MDINLFNNLVLYILISGLTFAFQNVTVYYYKFNVSLYETLLTVENYDYVRDLL